jgi:hypothetical protein
MGTTKILETAKRGRGRPKNQNTNIGTSPNTNFNSMGVPETPKTSYKVTLRAIFSFSGKTLAATTNFNKFELDEPEVEVLAVQGDECLIEFFPNINNRYGKLVAFLISVCTIFGKRYFDYYKFIKEKNDQTTPVKKEENKNSKNMVVSDSI